MSNFILQEIQAIRPGEHLNITEGVVNDLFPAANLAGPFGPRWSAVDRLMESIVGSAYEFRIQRDRENGYIVVKRLETPLTDGRRTYVSPDRRYRFTCDSDGYFVPASRQTA